MGLMEKIISLCKRRGFIFPSSEIYGGFESCYDYGPLGVELKNNIKKAWWKSMVQARSDIVGLDSGILMNPKVWEASGHLTAGFADPLVECKSCHHRFKADEIREAKCPECGGKLTQERKFNLMMKTFVGSLEDKTSATYLRPETCQGIYLNYELVKDSMRLKLPFGIAQIGKAFRNEITPGNFTYRTREFEQMEMQWFCSPRVNKTTRKNADSSPTQISKKLGRAGADKRGKKWDANKWFEYWQDCRFKWYLNFGVKKKNLRLREQSKDELAHYAKRAVDIEYKFPFGWNEFEGIHNRGDFDLKNHAKHSGKELKFYDESSKRSFIPHIIETSAGVDRSALVILLDAYQEIKGGRTKTTKASKETEVVLKLHKDLAPIKIAVLPLVRNKPKLVKIAKEVYDLIKPHFMSQYDEVGSIGRRYRRGDEVGIPFAVTIDFETLKDKAVTVRHRDSMEQERVRIGELVEWLRGKFT